MGTVRILLSSPLWRTAALSTLHEFIKHATNPSTANFSPLCVCVCVYVFSSHIFIFTFCCSRKDRKYSAKQLSCIQMKVDQ